MPTCIVGAQNEQRVSRTKWSVRAPDLIDEVVGERNEGRAAGHESLTKGLRFGWCHAHT